MNQRSLHQGGSILPGVENVKIVYEGMEGHSRQCGEMGRGYASS